ncbi:MAG TPA: response regulator transcription factor [Caulobacter sp.]|nr:response regulator transcription factor [Caulobacter sp.]
MPRILLVEDEPEMARLVASNLARAGLLVDHAGDAATAREMIALTRYGLVLLDRGLPDGDGLTLLPFIRKAAPGAPVLMLTALDRVDHKVAGLDAGADDYLTKPFFTDELLARIRAALRRPGAAPAQPVTCGAVTFDPDTREVKVGGRAVAFNRRELLALEILVLRAGRVVQRHALSEAVFGLDDDVQPKALDGHVSRLRKRLADLDAGVAIHAIRNVGYLLKAR